MKTPAYLAKKLSAYSLVAGAFLLAEKSGAQILYTDVVPDDTVHLNINNFAVMDFNNDGFAEIRMAGYSIGTFKSWSIGFNGGYGSVGLIGAGSSNGASALSSGYAICQSNSHLYFLGLGTGVVMRQVGSKLYGDFQPCDHDKFIGLSPLVPNDGNRNYGWIRVDIAADTSFIIVKDYAVNLTADACIIAGEGIPSVNCSDNYEPNNSSPQSSLIPVNKKIQALIDEPGDKDWFQFTPPADKNHIRIVLKKLPANYNIKLYDQNMQLLNVSKLPGKISDTIILNNADPSQHYYVVVKGQNTNAFNEMDCYTLKVEASDIPFKLIEQNTLDNAGDELELFPNPASDKIFISGTNEKFISEVSVFELSGRKIFTEKIMGQETVIDVSIFPEGFYVLEVRNENETLVKKFEVKR